MENDVINGAVCDTLFYQGNGSSQTQALKYIGKQKIKATTGQYMWCTGRNNLEPLHVIYNLHIGCEIADVDLNPFNTYLSRFNPIKIIGATASYLSNRLNGFHFSASTYAEAESVTFHAPILSQVSIGQESDIQSHRQKYDSWLQEKDKKNGLILWGVSRGTAATFCAFAQEKYPEVRLVVLEGAIDSVDNILPKRVLNTVKSSFLATHVTKALNQSFSFFNRYHLIQYRPEGPSPLKSVENFPENIPVVFITSELDQVVTCRNTENIANKLAEKGKNDVYLLKLKHSSHPNYMFDHAEDRDTYEAFIHAIYKKYHLQHNSELAEKGQDFIAASTLYEMQHNTLSSNALRQK